MTPGCSVTSMAKLRLEISSSRTWVPVMVPAWALLSVSIDTGLSSTVIVVLTEPAFNCAFTACFSATFRTMSLAMNVSKPGAVTVIE